MKPFMTINDLKGAIKDVETLKEAVAELQGNTESGGEASTPASNPETDNSNEGSE